MSIGLQNFLFKSLALPVPVVRKREGDIFWKKEKVEVSFEDLIEHGLNIVFSAHQSKLTRDFSKLDFWPPRLSIGDREGME